jgi:Major capsid protein N-terminus/Large eukaryotic DNA virus major capsid protein
MSTRPRGPITTLLDLTDRDAQENDLFPLDTDITWFSRDGDRQTVSFTPQLQRIPFRGPAAFGQRFSFDVGSALVGDLLFGAVLQIRLGHWLDATTLLRLQSGAITYTDASAAWEYANVLGAVLIAQAELEIDGKTVETVDGDFLNVVSLLFPDANRQVSPGYDMLGRRPIQTMRAMAARPFPTEDGVVHCPLPFFFSRIRYQEALPLVAIRDGLVRIHVTLRPFSEVVRQIRGYRDTCTSTPLGTEISFTPRGGGQPTTVQVDRATPELQSVGLVCFGAILQGQLRQKYLRTPFEIMHREVQTFTFDEPTKYTVAKQSEADTITVQLPLEANHPLEEILWFVRRKDVAANSEWTNYSDRLERDWPAQPNPAIRTRPLLVSAQLQINGLVYRDMDEQFARYDIASKHKGGYAAYANYVYGITFAETPGEREPTGSINASRANSIRLTLQVRPPGDAAWEVKVFCIGINWMRFANGLANAVFED